ncbi:MAG: C1 family peptidase [Oscillospiraceae bacterium]|nr:C1 family peptidase [Oscillospiraceae bacterium]
MKKKRSLGALLLVFCMFFALFAGCTDDASQDPNNKWASYGLGFLDDDPEKVAAKMFTMSVDTAALPKKFDNADMFPPPGDQGGQGSCVAWATAYALRSCLNMVGGNGNYDKDNLFSPAYVYNQINGGEDRGSYISDAMELLQEQGVCTWNEMPYSDNDYLTQPNSAQRDSAYNYRISEFATIDGTNQIKQAIYENYGVVVGIDIYESFYSINTNNYIYNVQTGNMLGGHAICLVGFDDDIQAFKFINSWGDDWADHGFAYVSYEIAIQRGYAYTVGSVEDPDDPDPPDDPTPPPNDPTPGPDDPTPDPDDPTPTPKPTPSPEPPKSETFLINFNPNGGVGEMAQVMSEVGESLVLPQNQFTNGSAEFYGWAAYSAKNAGWLYTNGVEYGYSPDGMQPAGWENAYLADGATVDVLGTVDNDVVTLVAVWSGDDVYTLLFNANGGMGQMTEISAVDGVEWRLPNNQFTREGYAFAGWNIYSEKLGMWIYDNNGEMEYFADGGQPTGAAKKVFKDAWKTVGFSPEANDTLTLYAVWETGGEFSVKYNAMGGYGTMAPVTAQVGSPLPIKANEFIKDGAPNTFGGWYVYSVNRRSWLCRRGDELGYYSRASKPDDWAYVVVQAGESFTLPNLAPGELINLCAYWK